MKILSHRGLDLDLLAPTSESTLASFYGAAQEGHGVEVDLQLAPGGEFVIWHDGDARRWSGGKSDLKFSEMMAKDFGALEAKHGVLCRWRELADLMRRHPAMTTAVHIKGHNQNDAFFAHWLRELQAASDLHNRLLIFDLKVPFAERLRLAAPKVGLAPSVSHIFDRHRFNLSVGETLLDVNEVLQCRHAFDWVWLDEWDLTDANEGFKVFYEPALISKLRKAGFQIALISPELHKTQGHPDADTLQTLELRWKRLLGLGVDAICTDYPSRLARLHQSLQKTG